MGAGWGEVVGEKKASFQEPGSRKKRPDRRNLVLSQLLEGIGSMPALGPQTQVFGGFCSWGMVGVSHPAGEKRGKTFLLSSSLPHPGLASRGAEQDQRHTHPPRDRHGHI